MKLPLYPEILFEKQGSFILLNTYAKRSILWSPSDVMEFEVDLQDVGIQDVPLKAQVTLKLVH